MNARRAKALRRRIYYDASRRPTRSYVNAGKLGGRWIENHPTSPRWRYQAAKKQG